MCLLALLIRTGDTMQAGTIRDAVVVKDDSDASCPRIGARCEQYGGTLWSLCYVTTAQEILYDVTRTT